LASLQPLLPTNNGVSASWGAVQQPTSDAAFAPVEFNYGDESVEEKQRRRDAEEARANDPTRSIEPHAGTWRGSGSGGDVSATQQMIAGSWADSATRPPADRPARARVSLWDAPPPADAAFSQPPSSFDERNNNNNPHPNNNNNHAHHNNNNNNNNNNNSGNNHHYNNNDDGDVFAQPPSFADRNERRDSGDRFGGQKRDANADTTTVFVGNIDGSVSHDALHDTFSQFGEIVVLNYIASKRLCFVTYLDRTMVSEFDF
jgi:hypothetical protein